MKHFLITVSFLLILSGCDPLDEKYDKSEYSEVIHGNSNSVEQKAFIKATIENEVNKVPNEDFTYRQLIDQGKALMLIEQEKQSADLAVEESIGKSKDLSRTKFENIFSFKVVDKGSGVSSDNQNYISFSIEINNIGNKPISEIIGAFEVFDMFGEKLGIYNVDITTTIKPGATEKLSYKWPYSPSDYDEIKISNKPLDKLKIAWNPQKLLYSDNSIIEVE